MSHFTHPTLGQLAQWAVELATVGPRADGYAKLPCARTDFELLYVVATSQEGYGVDVTYYVRNLRYPPGHPQARRPLTYAQAKALYPDPALVGEAK